MGEDVLVHSKKIGNKQQTTATTAQKDKDVPIFTFEYELHFPIHFLSFSQRRFQGFQKKFEFDRKRVVVASDQEYAVIGYD
jgi:hypothetical protein